MKDNIIGSIVACALLIVLFGMMQVSHDNGYSSPSKRFSKVKALRVDYGNEFVNVEDLDCMAKNLYFEAGNQRSDKGMIAVGYTVLNRVNDKKYPDSVCDVIYQGIKAKDGRFVKYKCQFSWVCDGKKDVPNTKHYTERKAWLRAQRIALAVLTNKVSNPIGNSTLYHATYVSPYWAKHSVKVVKIESHIFYKRKS